VTGAVTLGVGRSTAQFTFDARSGPSGESPTGTVSYAALFISTGPLPVSCLTVSGNRATVIALIPPVSPTTPAAARISVEDNGTAGDRVDYSFLPTVPADCPVSAAVGEPLTAGDLTVHDAPALPTRTDQCRNGGWRTFGVFVNQGDCIRSVRHRARQACLFERAAYGVPAFRAKYGRGSSQAHAMRRCIRRRTGG
jgi:hypothetical protein